jgi:hypothetical protein
MRCEEMIRRTVVLTVLVLVTNIAVSAQYLGVLPDPDGPISERSTVRTLSREIALSGPDEGWSALNPVAEVLFNSGGPYGANDRGLWQGRGANGLIAGGGRYHNDFLDVVLAPEFTFSANHGYTYRQPVSGDPAFGNYGGALDQPQRFGNAPLVDLWPGNSSLTLYRWNTALRLGTESIRFGPGERNQLVLSDNAPGVPHVTVGTYTPWDTRVGELDWMFVWGRLSESEFFDNDSGNDHRLFVGGAFGWRPSFLPGWQFSLQRAFQSPWETADAYKVFQMFETIWKENRRSYDDTPTGEDDTDQTISVGLQYTSPAVPFRVYLEWARNDHAANAEDFLANPEHSRAYVTGFQYRHALTGASSLLLNGEITVINPSPTNPVRATGPWYRHNSSGGHGYTHRGQYLGAWIGTGANSQYGEVGWIYHPADLTVSGYVERVVFDNDFLYSLPGADYYDFNYQLSGGLRVRYSVGDFTVRSELQGGYHANPWWLDEGRRPNLRAVLSVEYEL